VSKIGSHTFLNGLRNALQNGCVGNGAADDTGALNTLANGTLQPTGGIIYFGPGTYRISSNITFPSNVMLLFCPGSALSIDGGVIVNIKGRLIAPASQIFGGTGLVVFGSGATREAKMIVIASPITSNQDTYLVKPGDANESITLPSFSSIRQIRLVILDAHPSDGLQTTYTITNSDASVIYLTHVHTSGDPAATDETDTELSLPHVIGLQKSVVLSATGTDVNRFKGWVEVTYY